jgi:signal transduction histidine kinase
MSGASSGIRRDSILVLDSDKSDLRITVEAIERQVPNAQVRAITSLAEYTQLVESHDFDIVVLDHNLADHRAVQLVHELRLKDVEPGVLVVSRSADPRTVAEIYHSGCHKCIVKEGRWGEELGPAVRHLLRIKRLEAENRRLLAKLTEANVLLEEKNRRLDEFSATVAHDIRGPLGGISMKLDYILETYGTALDERCAGIMQRALDSAERLAQIVQSMYEYAKLGAKATRMSNVDLKQLVHEVVLDLHFEESLDIKIGIGELPNIFGSPELLRRIFINLIGNAVRYNDKPEVVINISFEGFEEKSLGTFAKIAVSDNGPGIPTEDLDSIFRMFSRGANTSPTDGGSGIGLAVVQRISELHYGRVEVHSTVGLGTTFVVTLPTDKIELPA